MIAQRLEQIRARMAAAARRAGRLPGEVELVAVSKRKPAEAVLKALELGQKTFGESYIQEAAAKIAACGTGPRWHCIGHLQGNKARQAAELFQCVQTIDRMRIASRLSARAEALGREIEVLVQVNIGQESGKSGVLPAEAMELARQVAPLPGLRLTGLMTLPPRTSSAEEARPFFRDLARMAREMREAGILPQRFHLSMGMSRDFEVAIEEGATMVRVGTLLFGPRET